MRNHIKQLHLKLNELLPWFTAALVALSADWAGDALMKTFNVWFSGAVGVFSLSRGIYILIFIVSTIALYFQRYTFFRPRTRYLKNEKPEKRRHLILFLSNLDLEKGKFIDGVPDWLDLTDDLDRDIERMEVLKEKEPPLRWPWEMPLRSLRYHLDILQTTTIICSEESIEQVQWFLDICRRYDRLKVIPFFLLLKGPTRLVSAYSGPVSPDQGWDFEIFDELSDAIWTLIRKLRKQHGIEEHEIMIDFTGGQKVTSVVAAAITFNRKIRSQYVQTNYPWKPLSYDVIHASSLTEGVGM